MNEELKTKANELLLRLLEGVEEGSEFLAGEIPDVLEQFLMWKAAESVVWFLLGVTIAGFGLFICRCFWNASKEATNDEDKPVWVMAMFLLALITLLAVNVTMSLTWLKIWLAPKVYLLEYAAEVVK